MTEKSGRRFASRDHGDQRRPVDASMTLLKEITERPLDPGYAEAQVLKNVGKNSKRSVVSTIATGITLTLLVAGVTIAAISLRAPKEEASLARDVLEQNIEQRNTDYRNRQTSVEELREEISDLQGQNLTGRGQKLFEKSTALGVITGHTMVNGPGLTIELSDARPRGGDDSESVERVQDIDLQVVVNGLWASGAEAISINGNRLSAMSAIRSAGDAILVDFQPLQAPYLVEAIGDASRLETGMVYNQAGKHLQLLESTYDIGVDIETVDRISIKGGTDSVREAETEVKPDDVPDLKKEGEREASRTARQGRVTK